MTEEAVRGVLDDLRWLGLDWDEGPEVGGAFGPYRQSQRLPIYADACERLLAQGDAYRCYCTPEELEERRNAAMARGEAPGYDGRCRTLTDEERAAHEAAGRPSVVRFAMPDREWVVDDLVKGEVRFASGQLRDFVLMRSDGSPVFLLAVAVDDLLMGITHVVRGDDLLASAPRNAAVIEALGGVAPRYAHLPQVLGPDRQPLSKRHGSTSVQAFREQGYLAEALVNYLALLGWSSEDERGVPAPRRADRAVRPVEGVEQPGGVRHREAHLDEQPLHPVARRRRARGALPALPDRGGRDARRAHAPRGDAAREGADEDPHRVGPSSYVSCSPTTSS